MRLLSLTFSLTLLISFNSIFGQSYKYRNYTVDEGLPSSEVYHVIQDKKGFIWFATNQGVSRFDGYNFKNYDNLDGLPENAVSEIFEDYKGRIWFVPMSGTLSYFENDSIKLYPYNKIIQDNRNKGYYPIKKSFYVDNTDNVYISFYARPILGITSSGKTFSVRPQKTDQINLRYLVVLNKDALLYNKLGHNNQIIVVAENGLEKPVKINRINPSGSPRINATYHDSTIFYSEGNHLVTIKNFYKEKAFVFPSDIIWLSTDNDKIFWVGLVKNGIKAYSNHNLEEHKLHLLKNLSVSSMYKDKEGGYWFTTLEQGVFYFPSFEIQSLTKSENINAIKIENITARKNEVWFGGDNEDLYSFDFESVKVHRYFNERFFSYKLIEFIGDTLYVSSNKDGYATALIYNGKIINKIWDYYSGIKKLKDEKCYLFCRSISYLENGKVTGLKTFRYNNIYCYDVFLDDKENLWIGTEKGMFINVNNRIIDMADSNKLYSNRIQCIENAKNNSLWIGTKGAGLLYKTEDTLLQFTTKDGLPGNSINSISTDDSVLWLATNKGVAKMYIDSIKFNKMRIEVFSVSNGMINNEINDIELVNDYVFAATNKGVSFFRKNLDGINKYPLPVYINGIKILGNDTVIKSEYFLDYFQNHIEISFVGLSYKNTESIKYKYILKGIDNEWKTTKSKSVLYSYLPPGSYEFNIKAINESGIESENILNIRFYIRKPYWEMYWFKVLIILAIIVPIVTIVLIIQYIKHKEKQKRSTIEKEMNEYRQKALSVQMNPHFLYNSLNSIQNYILKNDLEKSSNYLSKFGKLMRKILDNSQKSLISLKEELEALNLYIDMELVRFRNSFEYSFTLDENIDINLIQVPPLIIQPYVENAIHHGLREKKGKKELKIAIYVIDEVVHITIEDNGIGRIRAKEIKGRIENTPKSLGTEITEKRLHLFKEVYKNIIKVSTCDLFDTNNEISGTKVELLIVNDSKINVN